MAILKSLKKLISSAKLKFEINNIILINNSSFVYLDQDITRLMNFAEEIILIHGTNECLEFSGYKQGLTESIKYDVDGALILNDTFNFPRNFFPFLQYAFFDAMQKTDCSKKVYLGEFMHLKRDGYILNLSMRFFISTYASSSFGFKIQAHFLFYNIFFIVSSEAIFFHY